MSNFTDRYVTPFVDRHSHAFDSDGFCVQTGCLVHVLDSVAPDSPAAVDAFYGRCEHSSTGVCPDCDEATNAVCLADDMVGTGWLCYCPRCMPTDPCPF